MFVDEGDVVKQGQVIARIDSNYREPQQRQAQAGVDSAKAALLQNEQNQAQTAAARQQAQALQSQFDNANLNLHETEIHAPFSRRPR